MIKVYDNIWIGNSNDERRISRLSPTINCVLVAANDLIPFNNYKKDIEYMQVGLIDGPGNPLAAYHAAVLALLVLTKRHLGEARVLVCDHDGGRSLAITVMYLYLFGLAPSWDECIERLGRGQKLPDVNPAHRNAFFEMDWGMMTRVLDKEVV